MPTSRAIFLISILLFAGLFECVAQPYLPLSHSYFYPDRSSISESDVQNSHPIFTKVESPQSTPSATPVSTSWLEMLLPKGISEASWSATIQIPENLSSKTYFIDSYIPVTHEVFWNETELTTDFSQPIRQLTPVPPHLLTEGVHKIRISTSSSEPTETQIPILLGIRPLDELLESEKWKTFSALSHTAFILFGIYFLGLFTAHRKNPLYLSGGLTCIFFGLHGAIPLAMLQFGWEAESLIPFYRWSGIIDAALILSISVLCVQHLRWPTLKGTTIILVFLGLLSLFFHWQDSRIILLTLSILLGLTCYVATALRLRQSFVGMGLSGLLILQFSMGHQYQTGFEVTVLIMLLLIGILQYDFKSKWQGRNQSELKNARLELELIKSKIEPHFLLNSLTSAMEWIESDPKEGVKFIQALATEFDILSKNSGKDLISLNEEIETCHAYLKIMSYRRESRFSLETKNINQNRLIPPSIFRNLVENAITHNAYAKQPLTVLLEETSHFKFVTYTFASPYYPQKGRGNSDSEGTGIRYIKARLSEKYPYWDFRHGPRENQWITTIQIPI